MRSESVNIYDPQLDNSLMPSKPLGLRSRMNRSGSLYVEPRISESVLEKSEKQVKPNSAIYLKERGILRHMIQSGEVIEARNFIKNKFKQLYDTSN